MDGGIIRINIRFPAYFAFEKRCERENVIFEFQTYSDAHAVPEIFTTLTPPYNLLRLSFDTKDDALAYWCVNANMRKQIWLWHENLGNCEQQIQQHGICDICECQTKFTSKPRKMPDNDRFAFRVSWWHSSQCDCGLTCLDRAVFRFFLDGGCEDDRVYHVGYHSPLRKWLSQRLPNVTASQYEPGRMPGEVENGIQYEDLVNLSFSDNQFDCIICTEILEHIPDYEKSLHEMLRVLKPGGRALLTFPWLGGEHYEHFVRAVKNPDGSINHLHPPQYHGDPANAEGILSFRDFGWKILDELRDAGFARVSAKFLLGPLHGYMQLLTPVVVAVR